MIIGTLIALGLGGLTWLYFFRESRIAELAISFLPYIVVGLVVLAGVLLGILLVNIIKHNKIGIFLAFLFLWSTLLGIIYSSEFFSFYSMQERNWINQAGLRIYYANILYTNYDYESLKKQIDDNGYDMVVLVEFSQQHEKALKEFFQERFPYVNRNGWSTKLAGDVVFSKYPITNELKDDPQNRGKWKYSYLKVAYGDTPYYFYVVHTSAPVSMKNFQMRNQQLKKLTDEFIAQSNERPADAAVVMLGDFNLSPWSAFYTLFEEKIEGKVSNIFKNEKPVFTRSLRGQKIVNAHIDHVFVSPNVTVGGLVEVNNLAGSDHRAISFDVMNWSSHIRKLQVLGEESQTQ